MTTRFDADRFHRSLLPQSVGNLVDHRVLHAVGALYSLDEGYVRAMRLAGATGMSLDQITDTLAEAVERGLVTRVRGGVGPIQEAMPEDEEACHRRELGLCVDCETCLAPAFAECRTAAGRLADGQHQPRRKYAANWIHQDRQAAA